MNFYIALKEVARGEKIRRESWEDRRIYCDLYGGLLTIHNEGITNEQWMISESDFRADDWTVYEEPKADPVIKEITNFEKGAEDGEEIYQ